MKYETKRRAQSQITLNNHIPCRTKLYYKKEKNVGKISVIIRRKLMVKNNTYIYVYVRQVPKIHTHTMLMSCIDSHVSLQRS